MKKIVVCLLVLQSTCVFPQIPPVSPGIGSSLTVGITSRVINGISSFFSGDAQAQSVSRAPDAQNEMCNLAINKPIKKVQLPSAPSWFISANPNGESVGVILDAKGGNHMLSLDEKNTDGKPKMINVPGGVDPVFTPDGWFLTEPGSFYDAEKLNGRLDREKESNRINEVGSTSVASVYQSIGVLETDGRTKAKYMYIGDPDSVRGGNLEFSIMEAKRNPLTKSKTLTEVKTGVLCPELTAHTPMISTDGKYLSVINDETMTTQIFKVGADGSKCDLMVDLGVPTGKVTFDFETNPRKIAFHVDRHNTTIDWFQSPSNNMSKDTYVMNIDVEDADKDSEKWNISSMQKVSNNVKKGTGTYYPRFDRNGDIIAIDDDSENYYISKYDLGNGADATYDQDLFKNFAKDDYACNSHEYQKFAAIYGLASLYSKVCEEGVESLRMKDAALIGQAMTQDACIKLVEENFKEDFPKKLNLKGLNNIRMSASGQYGEVSDKKKSVIGNLTKIDLLNACPGTDILQRVISTETVGNVVEELTPEGAFKQNCSGCHLPGHTDGGFMFKDENGDIYRGNGAVTGINPDSAWKSINQVLNPDSIVTMPPSEHVMDKDTLEMVVEYLKGELNSDAQKRAADKLLQRKIESEY